MSTFAVFLLLSSMTPAGDASAPDALAAAGARAVLVVGEQSFQAELLGVRVEDGVSRIEVTSAELDTALLAAEPWYEDPWFWVAVGAAAAGGAATAAAIVLAGGSCDPRRNFPTICA